MNINKNNYEAFFLDYHEGNLSPQQVADLLLFVEQHPELREEFESFENLTLDDMTSISFEDKSSLKKDLSPALSKGEGDVLRIDESNYQTFFIGSVEDTLNPAEKNLLNDFIKQHPQLLTELELFQKTKLTADHSVVFENKDSLKRNAVTTDDLLIASVEGLLTKSETILLNGQLGVDPEMNHNLSLYKQTKLVADTKLVYENKEELKRKEKKIIPLFYFVSGVAAAIILMIGLFFLFNSNDKKEPQFAKKESGSTIQDKKNTNPVLENGNESIAVNDNNPAIKDQSAKKNSIKNNKIISSDKKDPLVIPYIKNEISPVNIAENKNNNKPDPLLNNEQQPIANNNQLPLNNEQAPAIASVQNKTDSKQTTEEYLSLRELAAVKIKEKTLDKNTLASQKKSGRSKRFSGWDVAQIVTRGISKVTGRDVELKPTYNDEGDVTAYALGKGIEHSKGR